MTYHLTMNEIYIKSTPAFDRKADNLMREDALEEFLDHIGKNPDKGKIITGTGGVERFDREKRG